MSFNGQKVTREKKVYSSERPQFDPSKKTTDYLIHKKNHKKYVREFVDCDYLEKLSPTERSLMDTFLHEYYDNSFKDNRLHSDKEKHEIGQSNNERRRDGYAMSACSGKLDFDSERTAEGIVIKKHELEDEIIGKIDQDSVVAEDDSDFYFWENQA